MSCLANIYSRTVVMYAGCSARPQDGRLSSREKLHVVQSKLLKPDCKLKKRSRSLHSRQQLHRALPSLRSFSRNSNQLQLPWSPVPGQQGMSAQRSVAGR